jgi:hypothetical protein
MADAPALIPLDKAVACVWPHSAEDERLHLRIVAGDLTPQQRAWLEARGGRATILDPLGQGDCRVFWQQHGGPKGWHDAAEIRRELGKIDSETGKYFRLIASQLRENAA